MSDTPIIVEKRKSNFTLYSLIGMLVLGGAFFYIVGREIGRGNGSAFDLVLALITLFIIILLGWSFFNEPTVYTLYKDRLVMNYFWRKPKTLLFADIICWDEQTTRGKHQDHHSLILYTESSKVTVVDTFTDSYYMIKNLATNGRKKGRR
jgi:hypothetical protein